MQSDKHCRRVRPHSIGNNIHIKTTPTAPHCAAFWKPWRGIAARVGTCDPKVGGHVDKPSCVLSVFSYLSKLVCNHALSRLCIISTFHLSASNTNQSSHKTCRYDELEQNCYIDVVAKVRSLRHKYGQNKGRRMRPQRGQNNRSCYFLSVCARPLPDLPGQGTQLG